MQIVAYTVNASWEVKENCIIWKVKMSITVELHH